MGPPRHSRALSSGNNGQQNRPHPSRRYDPVHISSTPQVPQPDATPGMTAQSRYMYNLKVLRRRDPSIQLIFDQFSHVCVYHHNGSKWEKQGFEGSMFLFERAAYPPYGFYILNRMGMDDHIQKLYPEDNVSTQGGFLMLRSFPEFTSNRIREAEASASGGPNNLSKFSPVYSLRSEAYAEGEKGQSITIGLWMFATDSREPMIDVMLRLHSFIKQNEPYPSQYQYGPDRPPPPSNSSHQIIGSDDVQSPNRTGSHSRVGSVGRNGTSHLRQSSVSTTSSSDSSESNLSRDIVLTKRTSAAHRASPTVSQTPVSELDVLFSKLTPSTSNLATQQGTSTPATTKMSVHSLFAALGGNEIADTSRTSSRVEHRPEEPRSSALTPNRGLALLDTIFASATPSPPIQGSLDPQSGSFRGLLYPESQHRQDIHDPYSQNIQLPAPSPQILTPNVISSLLGLPPSQSRGDIPQDAPQNRSASTVSSHSTSSRSLHSDASSQSRRSRYEGDNENSTSTSDGSGNESSFVRSEPTDGRNSTKALNRFNEFLRASRAEHKVDSDVASGYSESSTVLDPEIEEGYAPMLSASGRFGGVLEPTGGLGGPVDARFWLNGDVTPRAQPLHSLNADDVPRGRARSAETGSPRQNQAVSLEASSSTSTVRDQSPSCQATVGTLLPARSTSLVLTTTSGSGVLGSMDSDLWPHAHESVDEDADIVELDFADTRALSDMKVYKRKLAERKSSAPDRKVQMKPEHTATESVASSSTNSLVQLTSSFGPVPTPATTPSTTISSSKSKGKLAKRTVDSEIAKEALITTLPTQNATNSRDFITGLLTLIHTDKQFVESLWQDYLAKTR